MLYTILLILYFLIALSIVISLLINGVRPSKTLGWLLAIFTIPVGGALLYLMVGRNRRKNNLLRRKSPSLINGNQLIDPLTLEVSERHRKIVRLIQKNNAFDTFSKSFMSPSLAMTDGYPVFQIQD